MCIFMYINMPFFTKESAFVVWWRVGGEVCGQRGELLLLLPVREPRLLLDRPGAELPLHLRR